MKFLVGALASEVGSARTERGLGYCPHEQVLSGPQGRVRVLTDAERTRISVHEPGHAVVAAANGLGDQVHRISIVA